MNDWTEIRRKVLIDGASKRSIIRDYGIGGRTLAKILAHSEPPGYRSTKARRKPKLKGLRRRTAPTRRGPPPPR